MSAHGVATDRVTVKVSEEQLRWLNAAARERGVAVSDLIRRLIDETRGAYLTPKNARRAAE
jgi:hypothetical protein